MIPKRPNACHQRQTKIKQNVFAPVYAKKNFVDYFIWFEHHMKHKIEKWEKIFLSWMKSDVVPCEKWKQRLLCPVKIWKELGGLLP